MRRVCSFLAPASPVGVSPCGCSYSGPIKVRAFSGTYPEKILANDSDFCYPPNVGPKSSRYTKSSRYNINDVLWGDWSVFEDKIYEEIASVEFDKVVKVGKTFSTGASFEPGGVQAEVGVTIRKGQWVSFKGTIVALAPVKVKYRTYTCPGEFDMNQSGPSFVAGYQEIISYEIGNYTIAWKDLTTVNGDIASTITDATIDLGWFGGTIPVDL